VQQSGLTADQAEERLNVSCLTKCTLPLHNAKNVCVHDECVKNYIYLPVFVVNLGFQRTGINNLFLLVGLQISISLLVTHHLITG